MNAPTRIFPPRPPKYLPLHVVFGVPVGVPAAEHHPCRVGHDWSVAPVRAPHPQAGVVVHGDGHLRGQLGEQTAHDAVYRHAERVKKGLHGVPPLRRGRVGVPGWSCMRNVDAAARLMHRFFRASVTISFTL